MADSLRETVIQAVKTRMETIQVANGYETDIGNSCFLWKTSDWGDSELPGINVADTDEKIVSSSTGLTREDHHLTVNLICVCSSGTATAVFVRKMMSDVYKAIGVDRKFGLPYVQMTWPRTSTVQIGQAAKVRGGALITIEVIYRTNLFDPYA